MITVTHQPYAAAAPKAADNPMVVVVVESDPGIRWSLEQGLSHSGYRVKVAKNPQQAVAIVHNNGISAVLMEIRPEAGFTVDVLSRMMASGKSPVILCSSVTSSPDIVMDCVQRGASGFLPRPFSLGEVRAELLRGITTRRNVARVSGEDTEGAEQEPSLVVGVSDAIQEVRAVIRQVAKTNLNCLVRGASGVGKDVVAREIHRLSARHNRPFVKVNCTALPEQLLESELFGYEKGAFTGAISSKPGRFSLADKGIVFLDEICDVPLSVQAKLLQVMEHKVFTKLGGLSSVKVDVQIIAATNAPIEERIKGSLFRKDLFFRMNELCIWVPPLAERKEDIPVLVRHFMHKHGPAGGAKNMELSVANMRALCAWDWPGNVRELESTVKRWLTLGQLQIGTPGYVERRCAVDQSSDPVQPELRDEENDPSPETILAVLEKCKWNRKKATQVLGISYPLLRRRIIKHNLTERNLS